VAGSRRGAEAFGGTIKPQNRSREVRRSLRKIKSHAEKGRGEAGRSQNNTAGHGLGEGVVHGVPGWGNPSGPGKAFENRPINVQGREKAERSVDWWRG